MFTAVAAKNVRILTLPQEFFLMNQDAIAGLKDAIIVAEQRVEDFGVPVCDFIKFSRTQPSALFKFKRAVNHVIMLNKINKKTQSKFLEILNQMKQKIKSNNSNTKKRQLRYLKKYRSYERVPMDKMNAKMIIERYKYRRESDAITHQWNQRLALKKQGSLKSTILNGFSKDRTKSIV